ncbi:hypothetical protein RN629_04700 [Sphingomonadaceae bacterium jetA1]|jgi:hypothetical protein|uniref:hypothetical protein n=1 Tax=Facivitalis istanbulensis TaxID=3075838 RepID=UPI0034935F9A
MMILALLAAQATTPAATSDTRVARPILVEINVTPVPEASATARPLRYCFRGVRDDQTRRGKVCRSRAQWMEHGIDPLDSMRRGQ